MLTRIKVVHVGPVGDDHAVPVQAFLQPAGQEFLVGMYRDAVDGSGIHHDAERSGADALLERGEITLPELLHGGIGRCTVLARQRNAIGHVMLGTGRDLVGRDVVRIRSLVGNRDFTGHLRREVRIFAPALPAAGPAGVTTQVHDRGEYPRRQGSTGLIGQDIAHVAGVFSVEGGRDIDFLREENGIGEVGRTMDLVQAVQTRNADLFHGNLLETADDPGRMGGGLRPAGDDVQDGPDFITADDFLEFGFIHLDAVHDLVDRNLDHLPDFFVEGHLFQGLFDIGFEGLVLGDGRRGKSSAAGRSDGTAVTSG